MHADIARIENSLLDELASTMETISAIDVQIRDSVDSCEWDAARHLAIRLVDFLTERRISSEDLRRKLIGLAETHSKHAIQIQRCSDISTHVVNVVSKYLPVYQRIVSGLDERRTAAAPPS